MKRNLDSALKYLETLNESQRRLERQLEEETQRLRDRLAEIKFDVETASEEFRLDMEELYNEDIKDKIAFRCVRNFFTEMMSLDSNIEEVADNLKTLLAHKDDVFKDGIPKRDDILELSFGYHFREKGCGYDDRRSLSVDISPEGRVVGFCTNTFGVVEEYRLNGRRVHHRLGGKW